MENLLLFHLFKINNKLIFKNLDKIHMGIGDWGLGIGDWGLCPNPKPQYPLPQPPTPTPPVTTFIKR